MKHAAAALVLLIALAMAPAASAQDEDGASQTIQLATNAVRPVLRSAVEDFIRPGYAALAESAAELKTEVAAHCDAPSMGGLEGAREAFGETVVAYSRIEPIRFGPVLSDNAMERLFFYPDRRGIGLRQVQAVLSEEDASATDPEALGGKSVALQGLGTLEFLLFGSGSEELATGESGDFRCRFAEAVAQRIDRTAADISEAWQASNGIANRLADPAPGHDDFQSTDDALRALLGVFTNGLELVRDARLAPALAESDNGRPWRRAELTESALAANIEGLSALFERSNMADLLAQTDANLPSEVRFEFENVAGGLQRAMKTADETARREQLAYVSAATGFLRDIFATRVAAALGQSPSFSSMDGD